MIKKIEAFLEGNKLFIIGLISAIAININQYFTSDKIQWEVVVFSGIIAGLSFAAKNLSGKIASLFGIAGTTVTSISVVATGGMINIPYLVSLTLLAVLSVFSGGAHSTKDSTVK